MTVIAVPETRRSDACTSSWHGTTAPFRVNEACWLPLLTPPSALTALSRLSHIPPLAQAPRRPPPWRHAEDDHYHLRVRPRAPSAGTPSSLNAKEPRPMTWPFCGSTKPRASVYFSSPQARLALSVLLLAPPCPLDVTRTAHSSRIYASRPHNAT
ncbi:hypothetical protein BD626DRAFT_260759 [Schizophyllum amplum]|uniref:Uncharacterized protein n=1 Tax=Schizophyllum amplum TaxID=97359 RepID=A0A550CGG3_9AGAR|nr:hypothetical protein BD626DRAFT_260759 [Auriculariopsis ampla]